MGQKPLNEDRQMASKIKIVNIGQSTVFLRGVVGFFQVKETDKNVFFFWQKHYEKNCQIVPAALQCYAFSENRTAPRRINLWIPRPTSIACSSSSPSFCISNWLRRSEQSLPGFGIATMVAFLQEGGKIPDSQMGLKIVSSRVNELTGRFVRSL